MIELYRVFTHTLGDESVTERIVAASSDDEAKKKAISNVKAQNLGKGFTDEATSRKNTRVLCVKKTGRGGVLTVGRIPMAAIQAISTKV